MKVILMTDVPVLGRRGDLKDVATGYARNYLLPKRLAVLATPGNLQNLEHLKRQREREESRAVQHAQATGAAMAALTFTVAARASEDGRLYGSVSAQDIVDFLGRNQLTVEKRRVQLDEPIKTLGEHRIPVRLHGDVTATLTVNVTRE